MSFEPIAELPGRCVGLISHSEGLFALYERPRKWWQFWRKPYGVEKIDFFSETESCFDADVSDMMADGH